MPTRDAALPPPLRCKAHNRDGAQCGSYAMRGGVVCRMHGGAAGQTRRKAQQRLEEAADRLARALIDLANNAESEAVRLAAIKDALDRAGVSAKQKLEVEVGLSRFEAIATRIITPVASLEVYEDAVIVEDDSDLPPDEDMGRR